MKKILIDTDVILDFFFDRKPFSENSAIILSMCERKQIEGFVTPVIISNTYYLLRRTAPHLKVIEKLKQLLSITQVLQMNRTVIEGALNSEFKDFEDALQNYSAVESGVIEAIITRNVKDFKKSEIAVLTPESFVRFMKA
ncbi:MULTISPECIES: PIN domain-containing protein [unclassified Lentimicrobium]|uniref:type II toxin-antitoxin system VapC family toxin n=1 Tax=unclassified Lentimicrobium TaxID=2677434 RepID=UPI0015526599|nr:MULTISPECIES: PIN domain-containing protein [unclassified Lentimicrobium]NPD45289.1 PIN domain-containing protein [Lentimicrobium sp. S6]NPD84411.1 PIN domain-containing protein [Lentimicrobium sp. L6]